MKSSVLLLSSVSVLAFWSVAHAESTVSPSIGSVAQNILSSMSSAGGSETLQWEVAPSYSELFGLGVRTTVGGLVNEDFALGVIIDYAEHREEYLANAGVRLNDTMRVIGSVGILKESEEFTLGEGRQDVEQLEYGLSLKGNYEAGIIRGFELNAYATDASSNTDTVETGDLTGVQLVTQLKPSEASDIRIGAGYERAEWAGGDVDEGFTFQALGSQKLSDMLSLNYSAKSAETENVYGLGLTYDLSSANVQNSALSISFNQIEGKHGISDDTRVAVNWTVGFGGAASEGAGADTTISSMGGMPSPARKDLLAEVMTRPAFLPERVLARSNVVVSDLWSAYASTDTDGPDFDPNGDQLEVTLKDSIKSRGVAADDFDWTLYNLTDGTSFKPLQIVLGEFESSLRFTGVAFGNGSVGGCNNEDLRLVGTVKVDGKIYTQQKEMKWAFCG